MARPAVIVHHPHTLASTSPQTWKPTFGVTTGCTIDSYGASPLCSDCLSRNRLIGASAESGYLRSRVAQSRGAVPVSVAGGDARSLGRDGQVRDSLAWGMVGSKSSTGLPEGSSAMICLPPTPVTRSLRNRTPSRRRCVMAAARSGTSTANRFQPPVVAGEHGEHVVGMHVDAEPEVPGVEADRGVDVVDDVADADCCHGSARFLCGVVRSRVLARLRRAVPGC